MLTTDTDVIESTAKNDAITGTDLDVQDEDIIFGGEGIDTLNLTIATTGAAIEAPTVLSVENINVNSTALAGGVVFDATNVTDATITTTVSKFGADGVVEITAAGTNNVVAGSGVKELTITDIADATITTSGADIIVDTATAVAPATGHTVTINASNDFALTFDADNAGKDTAIINGAVTVDITGSTLVAGDTLTATDATIKAAEVATAATLTAAVAEVNGAANVDKWTAGSIVYKANSALTNVANNQSLTIDAAGLTVSAVGKTGATAVTVNTAVDVTSLTTTVFTNTTVNVSDDVTIGTLSTAGTATLKGTGNVEIGTSASSTILNASELNGDLDITIVGALVEVVGAKGATTYTTGTATNTFVGQGGADNVTLGITAAGERFVGQFGAGDDTLDTAATVAAATVIADMGAGNDTIKMGAVLVAATTTFELDGGAGTDTLLIADTADFSAATLTLTNIEKVQVESGAGATTLAFNGSKLNGLTLDFSTKGFVTGDTLVTTVTADKATLDLSGISASTTGTSFVIDANVTATTIKGTKGADEITVDAAASTVTGGAGSDTFIVTNATTVANMTKITDFAATATANDILTTSVLNIDASVTEADLKVNSNVSTDVNAIFATATAAVTANISADGILTLTGTTADKALVNTLDKWVLIAESVTTASNVSAFQFNGNTYVFEQDATAANDAFTNLIELTGVTGITALDDTAAANTIVIA